MFGFIPQVQHEVLELRSVVSRKLHDERRSFALEAGVPEKQHAYDCGYDAQKVHAVGDEVCVSYACVRNDCARNGGEDRQFSAAGEERNNTNGCGTFFVVSQSSGVDHCRNGATESHDHRHKSSA